MQCPAKLILQDKIKRGLLQGVACHEEILGLTMAENIYQVKKPVGEFPAFKSAPLLSHPSILTNRLKITPTGQTGHTECSVPLQALAQLVIIVLCMDLRTDYLECMIYA
jgi:hypothetical protein